MKALKKGGLGKEQSRKNNAYVPRAAHRSAKKTKAMAMSADEEVTKEVAEEKSTENNTND